MRRSSPRSRRSCPHSAQNRAPAGTSARQLGQVTAPKPTGGPRQTSCSMRPRRDPGHVGDNPHVAARQAAGTVRHHDPDLPHPSRERRGGGSRVHATKVYGSGDTEVRALDDVSIDFEAGRFTAIMGPSGSGKSTLMHCVAGLDTLTVGSGLHRRHRPHHAPRQGPHPGPPGQGRLRVPELQPDPHAHRGGEHHAAARPGRSEARPARGSTTWCRPSASATA